MSPDFVTQLILQYRYWILIPLSFIEGPLIAFVAGTLAALNYFNIYLLAALFFVRDVGLDGVYYAIGYFGGNTPFVKRMLAKLGITADHLTQVRAFWDKRPGTTMFVGKLAYGVASAFIVVAGTVKMPLPKFFAYGSIVAILQYGTLLFLGYFIGVTSGGTAEKIIKNVQYVIGATAIILAVYFFITWRLKNKLLAGDAQIEHTSTPPS